MTTINKNTKRGQAIIDSWQRGEYANSIRDIYGNYSYAKEKAFNDCYSMYAEDAGSRDFRCTGHNSFSFSVAWIDGNGNLRYETSGGSYIIK